MENSFIYLHSRRKTTQIMLKEEKCSLLFKWEMPTLYVCNVQNNLKETIKKKTLCSAF